MTSGDGGPARGGRLRLGRIGRSRPFDDVPELTDQEVADRIAGGRSTPLEPAVERVRPSGRRPSPGGGRGPGDLDAAPPTVHDPGISPARRRRLLVQDSAIILIGIALAFFGVQVFLPATALGPVPSSSQIPTGVRIGTLAPPLTMPPPASLGPIVDPSLGLDATPTHPPFVTTAPTPSPSPSPSPSPTPGRSVKSTPKPTPKPSSTVVITPAPTAAPTATPPVAGFSWTLESDGLTVDFVDGSTNGTSWDWDFGDGATSTAQNPIHPYSGPSAYTVRLTVTGPGGTDTITHVVTVTGP